MDNMEKLKKEVESLKEEVDVWALFADMYANTKATSEWKNKVIKWLAILIVGLIVFIFVDKQIERYDRAQWDYVSTYETTGVYALVDSNGNVLASDLTPEQVEEIAKALAEAHSADDGGA